MAFTGRLASGRSRSRLRLAVALTLVQAFTFSSVFARDSSHARTDTPSSSALQAVPRAPEGVDAVPLSSLPVEARHTAELIRRGGPFPFRKDGVAFGNRERFLPMQPRGYYREYTVKTPRSRDRGARRIICGGQEPTAPERCYYTSDHYASFKLILQ